MPGTSSSKHIRLYSKGRFVGFKRGKHNQRTHTSLIQLENVNDTKSANFYLGKRVAYVYRGKKARKPACPGSRSVDGEKKETKTRVIWGKITRTHGNSGIVKAKFKRNLPAIIFGASVRVMMYPSRI